MQRGSPACGLEFEQSASSPALPMNRTRKSLKINRGAFCRFKGAMRVFVRGILSSFGPLELQPFSAKALNHAAPSRAWTLGIQSLIGIFCGQRSSQSWQVMQTLARAASVIKI